MEGISKVGIDTAAEKRTIGPEELGNIFPDFGQNSTVFSIFQEQGDSIRIKKNSRREFILISGVASLSLVDGSLKFSVKKPQIFGFGFRNGRDIDINWSGDLLNITTYGGQFAPGLDQGVFFIPGKQPTLSLVNYGFGRDVPRTPIPLKENQGIFQADSLYCLTHSAVDSSLYDFQYNPENNLLTATFKKHSGEMKIIIPGKITTINRPNKLNLSSPPRIYPSLN